MRQTALYHEHEKMGAQLVDFCGWRMPLHYGSQLQEHHQVRTAAGMFDVSHMGIVDIIGADAYYFLRYLLANDVQKLASSGRALYTCMLNEAAGVIDDLIVYRLDEHAYRLVVNAGSCKKVLAWLRQHTDRYDVIMKARNDLALLAIQGPKAIAALTQVLTYDTAFIQTLMTTRPFGFIQQDDLLIARTGYTGEDGIEVMLPITAITRLWKKLLKNGVAPCGLGARDTLRLEAGFNLYGLDMDENVSPLVSNLAWTISWADASRNFIGKAVLQQQLAQGVADQLMGLFMQGRGVMRQHQKVFFPDQREGEITSGGFSPTIGCSIALARVPVDVADTAVVECRGKRVPVKLVKPPFVKNGKIMISQ